MSASVSVLLYGTAGCHLCDRAEELLKAGGLAAEPVDIAADDALIDLKEPLIKSTWPRTRLCWMGCRRLFPQSAASQ